ncbi:MAG: methyltransferase [Crocinitomicaceae bacterium]
MGGDFKFKQFIVSQNNSLLKVGTDSMLLGSIVESKHSKTGLDLGAGNGVLSLMVAQKNPKIKIQAIELHQASFEECLYNFQRSKWSNRLDAIPADYFKHTFDQKYDFIFSNPPFYLETSGEIQLENQQSKHTTKEEFFELFVLVKELLVLEGVFWIVLPFSLYELVTKYIAGLELYINEMYRIDAKLSKPNSRVILAMSKTNRPTKQKSLVIRNEDNSYTESYINLTKEFHYNQLKK